MKYYNSSAPVLRYASPAAQCGIYGAIMIALGVACGHASQPLSMRGWVGMGMPIMWCGIILFLTGCFVASVGFMLHLCQSDCDRVALMVRLALFAPQRGNPLHLRDGELLPRVTCKRASNGQYAVVIWANASVTVDTITNAASSISSALNGPFSSFAVVQTEIDVAYNTVKFSVEDVTSDRSLTYTAAVQMVPENATSIRVDSVTSIDLSTSGSMLVAGKTRSGKTTGVIALLLQVLLAGPDEYRSSVIIIDPKQAELSRLPYTVTLDGDGEARSILNALCQFLDAIVYRQSVLNRLSENGGDAVKWWDAGMHPSFVFVDEYVALRSIFPKKAAKDSDYCIDTFDALIKRIVTTGASAGCFAIISIAEASVQEGGLPAMLRAAMSTRILFKPTLTEGRLIWDSVKLENFNDNRVYSPGDCWFSSTDGIHDAVSMTHFPHLDFPAYRALGQALTDYYTGRD